MEVLRCAVAWAEIQSCSLDTSAATKPLASPCVRKASAWVRIWWGIRSISGLPGTSSPFQSVEQQLGEKKNMIGHRQLTIEDYAAMFRRQKVMLILLAILGPAMAYLLCLVLPKEY